MATRLKQKDFPEAWLGVKKTNAKPSQHKAIITESTNVEDCTTGTLLEEHTKKGRGRPKGKGKIVDSAKRKGRSKSLSTSATDVILGRSKTPVPNVDELRRKIEEDAIACGRHVRSVLDTPNSLRSEVQVMVDPIEAENEDPIAPEVSSGGRFLSAKTSRIQPCAEIGKEVQGGVPFSVADRDDASEERRVHRPGKEPIVADLHQPLRNSKSVDNSAHRRRKQGLSDSDEDSHSRREEVFISHRRRSPSEAPSNSDERRRNMRNRRNSPEDGRKLRRAGLDCSISRSPRRKGSPSSRMEACTIRGRSVSRSPGRWRAGHQERTVEKETDFHTKSPCADYYDSEYRTSRQFSNRESWRRGRYQSTSPQKDSGQMRSPSSHENQRLRRRTSTDHRSSSSPAVVKEARVLGARHWTALTSVKKEGFVDTSSALGRKHRRHEQAIREEDMDIREKNGKKPFYLTLDPEGKPYGPGKPAWVAQINKLAAGLDPSCTHIRKQTYEAVQTLKDRLNDDFDYSGKLNEDHLRGLMGRAVTKRRGELIALIKSDGKQPLNIDYQVWRRLEKLAYSKQREEKSEQGRYANSCRKTLGRTGSKGVDGVREQLRGMLGRSPDPDEVEDELQRDKGYGGQKRKRRLELARREEDVGGVNLSDEDSRSQSVDKSSFISCSDIGSGEKVQRRPRNSGELTPKNSKRTGEERDYSATDRTVGNDMNTSIQRSCSGTRARSVSTDGYIETLKAEIQRLQAENEKACTSNAGKFSQSAMSTPCSGREGGKRRQVQP